MGSFEKVFNWFKRIFFNADNIEIHRPCKVNFLEGAPEDMAPGFVDWWEEPLGIKKCKKRQQDA